MRRGGWKTRHLSSSPKLRESEMTNEAEFLRLESLQERVLSDVKNFRSGDRTNRDEVHERPKPLAPWPAKSSSPKI